MTPARWNAPGPDTSAEHGVVPVAGTELRYSVAGSGPPLAFVHAGITDSRLWNHQVAAFADGYRVITYDLRGYGRSALPPEPYAHHEDLLSLFDALEVDRAHVVGASMGAATAVDFALENPGRVRSLTLIGPAIGGYDYDDPDTMAGWSAATEAFDSGDWDGAATIEADMWLAGVGRDLEDIDPAVRDLVHEMLLRSYGLEDDRATERELDPPAVARLEELAVPVFLVHGEHERADIVDVAHLIENSLDDVTIEVLADTAHLPSLERPEAFTATLESFLTSVTGE